MVFCSFRRYFIVFQNCFLSAVLSLLKKAFLTGECPENILCTEEEIIHLLQNIDVSKSSGPDRISGRMLKGTAHSIAPSITKIFNMSITLGCFPQTWKLSNVVPIPKSADNTSPTNYRPISLLSVLSKLLERHMYSQITSHLETHHPLSTSQWGFQSCRKVNGHCSAGNYSQLVPVYGYRKRSWSSIFRSTKGF